MEIFCYRFGTLLGIPVPPAHVAYDSDNDSCGALIEWFLKEDKIRAGRTNSLKNIRMLDKLSFIYPFTDMLINFLTPKIKRHIERYTPGGDYLQRVIPAYDRKQGEQHNYETTARICEVLLGNSNSPAHNWIKYWVITYIFDALIGNTDRHQDNWGIIWTIQDTTRIGGRLTPIFDNGTSMGHEIFENKFFKFDDDSRIRSYVNRGTHHMKWKLSDSKKIQHTNIVPLMISKYPESKTWIEEILDFPIDEVRDILQELSRFDVAIPLTEARANFMLKLVKTRKETLTKVLLES